MAGSLFALFVGDITTLDVDVIVNAANRRMLGGGGVDGAIHRAAGSQLRVACEQVPEVSPGVRCPTGEVRLTPGFQLTARYVIHTVGPVWSGGACGEPELLAACYTRSLMLAQQQGLASMAFPCISTGVYGYPKAAAARVAVDAVRETCRIDRGTLERILFCCFSEADAAHYRALI